jgi:TIR domain
MAAGPKTFVSYASEDRVFVLGLVMELSAAGADLWVDTLDIPHGALWDDQIDAALKACPQMLLVISPASMKSDNVRDEVAYALKRKRLIVPVLYEACDDDVIPYRIERIQLIDLRLKTEHSVRKVLSALNVPPRPKPEPGGLSWQDLAKAPEAAAPAPVPASAIPDQGLPAPKPYRSPFADLRKASGDAEPAKRSKSKR